MLRTLQLSLVDTKYNKLGVTSCYFDATVYYKILYCTIINK